MHGLADQPFGRFFEMRPEIAVNFGKLAPYDILNEPSGRPHHDRRPSLPRVAIGPQPVPPAERDEQPTAQRSGIVNCISIGGSCRPISASFARRRPIAASAATLS